MDITVLNNITYGMYIISTKSNNKNVGCIINTVTQITSEDPIISISLNKDNYTNKILKESKKCAISILTEKTKQKTISTFGYFSPKDKDKFKDIKWEEINNLPVVLENICGFIIGEVINVIDVNTHDIFLIKVCETKKTANKTPMTYRYYHEVLKGKAPKKAPTYNEDRKEDIMKQGNKYKCTICGYIYDDEKEEIKFEDLPDDWKCPICGVGKDKFVKI